MPKPNVKKYYGLRDSPFFRLRSRKKLAKLLHTSADVLHEISKKRNYYAEGAFQCELYRRVWKHKKLENVWRKEPPPDEYLKDYRPIDIPDARLKAVQARIANILSRIAPPDWLFSPVKGRSYVDNAARHKGARAYWLLDIENFFPSCSSNYVAWFFSNIMECSPDVVAVLTHCASMSGSLPQGSPCSPILSYFSNMNMWQEIEKIVVDAGLRHSVYADDITISGDVVRAEDVWKIKMAIRKHGFTVHRLKEASLVHQPADITGVIVVGANTKLPNRHEHKLHQLQKDLANVKGPREKQILENKISGRVAQKRQVENSS